jgi:replicative DNA helicase
MTEFIGWQEHMQAHPGIPFGLPSIDRVVTPLRPGNLVVILGRPGDGKTSLLVYLARQEARRIIARGAADREAVVYVTWEQTAEELAAFLMVDESTSISDMAWGRANLDNLRRKAIHGAGMPIWVIGHGISRAGQRTARMTPDVVLSAIENMKADYGVTPVLACFDYLQLIPVPHATERVQQVTEAPILIKELAMTAGVPAVCGVQAARDVDNRAEKLAEARDAQWASAIEQTADKAFSIWRPARSEQLGSMIKTESGRQYQVTETLFFLRLLKQRMERGRYTWALHFDPAYLKLAELETRSLNDD